MNAIAILHTAPPWLAALMVAAAIAAIGALIWTVLPHRNTDIERQIKSLRRHADHSVTHRPRLTKPKACGAGICRHQASCSDVHCPGRAQQ